MTSDVAAARIVNQAWDKIDGETAMDATYYGVVELVEAHEMKRFKVSRTDYVADKCAPCESYARKLRDEVAKILREEYGE